MLQDILTTANIINYQNGLMYTLNIAWLCHTS
ncbi:hypothetical protein [Wolbachia endosymbiont of Leptopilina clavipes]